MKTGQSAGLVIFGATRRQLRGQQLWAIPLVIVMWAGVAGLAAARGLLTGDAAIDLGVLLVVSVATLLTAPLWVARTAADRSGIRVNHRRPRSLVPWADIAEIQTIRKRGTERVALRLRAGDVRRLHAPYSGRWLANDPAFDDKVETLRTMWRRHGAPA
ncbi:hypothetical protein OG417_01650 [Actinoallomurus sp. NBC_01490]|uniref:hypothetical protein n=1 Tax=Actinoallomurus sp. NBC_01490 TaxID=2903557 RepID=UPI002E33B138|nr:hypothetical protein [Actinoallomurus sp. NBC_01490]